MKLKSETFIHHTSDAQRIVYTSEIAVLPDGLFQFSILPEFKDVFEIVKAMRSEFSKVKSGLDRKKRTDVILSPVKETGLIFMRFLIQEYYKCEATEEYVIRYIFHNQTLSVKDCFGRHYGNAGVIPEDRKLGWQRVGDLHIDACGKTDFYYVGLNAGLYRKQTFKRGDKTNIKYIHITTSCRGQIEEKGEVVFPDSYATKLASFNCMSTYISSPQHESEWKEVLYSENAAKFFYDLLISICQLGDKVNQFFNDPKSQQYISEGRTDDTGITLNSLIEYK